MKTTIIKKRINLSVSEDIDAVIKRLAERDSMPTASKALELIKKAIQIEEDDAFERLASERDTKSARYFSHARAWK